MSKSRSRQIQTALNMICKGWRSGKRFNMDGHPNNDVNFNSWEACTTAPRPSNEEMESFATQNQLKFYWQKPGQEKHWNLWFEAV